jgi:hypothetical protein
MNIYRSPKETFVTAKVIHDGSRSKGTVSGLSNTMAASVATKIVYDSNRPFISHQRYSDMNSKNELQSKIQIARAVAITDILASNPQADPRLLGI